MNDQAQQELEELKKKLIQMESSVISARKSLEKIEREYLKPDYTQIDGIVGWYDGKYMRSEQGEKYEVPANYAAKSKMVYGDTLKLIEEDGKKLFKQISKVARDKVEGIMTRKEGEWYILTDRGSYKVLDAAAEFQGAELNSQATAFIPSDKLDAPFASLDFVQGFGKNTNKAKPEIKPESVQKPQKAEITKKEEVLKPIQVEKKEEKKVLPKPQAVKSAESAKTSSTNKPRPAPVSKPKPAAVPSPKVAPAPIKEEKKEENSKTPAATSIKLDDDDLV